MHPAMYVCSTNSAPTMASDAIMARPGPRRPSSASSDSVAIPSKPKNDSTPSDTALNTSGRLNVAGL